MYSKLLRKYGFWLLGISMVLWSGQLLSLTIAEASLEEITQESSIIVRGTVSSIEYQWENPQHNAIETLITFHVDRYIKGSGNAQIVIKQMGGHIGDFGDIVSGTPQLTVGEDLVLFLIEHNGNMLIHSIALGCFRVIEKEGTKFIMNDLGNVYFVNPSNGQQVKPEDGPVLFELDAFMNKIQSFLED